MTDEGENARIALARADASRVALMQHLLDEMTEAELLARRLHAVGQPYQYVRALAATIGDVRESLHRQFYYYAQAEKA